MSEIQSQEEFDLFHLTTCKDLQLEDARLERELASPDSAVVPDLLNTVKEILRLVLPDGPLNPEKTFRSGLEAMELIDAKRFVVDTPTAC